jgi:hypothetical protein
MPKIISIHMKDSLVVDVKGIPEGYQVIITDVNDLSEVSLTSQDNLPE